MSKELYFTDGNNEVKYLDTTASFNLAITQDGSAFDLTNATAIDVKVANDTGYVFDKPIDMTTIKQPLAGLITMPVDAEVMNALVPDDYTIEVWVTLSSLITPGSQEGLTDDGTTASTTTGTTTYTAIFPSDDPQGFTITDNVMSDSGDVIPVMSLDEFQQEFDQLKTDLTNQVSTLKGPKGDTGQGLEIKGKVDTTSQLPKTASEGDGYLVGEELYVWTNGAWKDCGLLQGPQGIKGNTGTGVSSTTIQYQISSSATTAPTGTWSDNIVATTTTNPNLWMKATLHYTDGTTKDFYLVSQKGDKGDKGDRGNQIFNGKQYTPNTSGYWWSDLTPTPSVDNPPKIGDTIINPNGDILQIDTIVVGGVVNGGGTFGVGNVLENIKGATGPQGPVGAGLVVKGTVNSASQLPKTGNQEGYCYFVGTDLYVWDSGAWKNCGSVSPDLKNYVTVTDLNNGLSTKVTDNKNGTIEVNGSSITPADDSKVIHNSGNEEINGQKTFDTAPIDKATGNPYITKSDVSPLIQGAVHDGADLNNELQPGTYFSPTKVTNGPGFYTAGVRDVMITWTVTKVSSSGVTAYTQMAYKQIGNMAVRNFVSGSGWGKWTIIADDSKVLHSTVTSLNSTDMNTVLTAGFYQLNSGTNGMPNADARTLYQVIPLSGSNGVQLAYGTNKAVLGMRSWSTINGVITFTSWVQFADDSKVAHLSGANNFDTVPTVKNNPLLLASSLPSDLARTGQDANFTGKLQKSGIDVATKSDVTTAVSTATANMVDSSKPTNFTAGLQSGGIDVATAADLKSLEDSAWREVTNSAFQGSYLFRDNQDGTATLSGTIYFSKPTQTYNGLPDFIIPLPTGYSATGDVYDWDKIYNVMKIRDTDGDDSMVKSFYPGSAIHLYTYGNTYLSGKDAVISLYSPILPIFNDSSYTDAQKVGSADGFTIKVTKS